MNAQIIQTDDTSFDSAVLKSPDPVLVEFWAAWCPPCKLIAPIIADLATHYQGRLRVVAVNTDDSPDLASRWGVAANPSLLFFSRGRAIHRLVGAWPKEKIVAAIDQLLAESVS